MVERHGTLTAISGIATVGQYLPQPYINRFRRFGDTLMYAGGNTIYKLDPRVTGINELKNNKAYLTNYPNPFTDKTTISFILQRPSKNVILQVCDASGKVILFKNLGFQNVGQNNFIFEHNLPAGIYYYTLTTPDVMLSKKMVVVK